MSWSELHAQSEKLAAEAHFALRSGRASDARNLYTRAAELERKALDLVDPTKTRTRGITAVSAVALWFKAGEYAFAEQLAYAVLTDPQIPAFAREEMRNLVQAIWTESSKSKAGVAFLPGQVLVSVKGGEVVTGGAPLELILEKVQTIQSMFYRTVEFLNGLAHRKTGPPSKELQDSCRPWLFQSAPGSYQFSVAIEKPKQPDFFRSDVEPEHVAQHFLEIVRASSGGDRTELERIVPHDAYRATFLKLTRNLAPTGKTFDRIEFRASGETRPVRLDVEARSNVNIQLRQKPAEPSAVETRPEELRGTLRAVHLDRDWLEIAVDGASVHVEGLQDTVDDVIGPMVNKPVIVRVARMSPSKFKFLDIELAD